MSADAPLDDAPATTLSRERFNRIYRTLRTRICLLDHAPGSVLGETDLAAEFGTSRSPIRRVLGRLEAEGLVERRHGVGTIVTDVDLDGLRQVYALRVELAALMGKLAPLAVSEAGLAQLRACRARSEILKETLDPAGFARLNMDFHVALHAMIGNAPLRDIVGRLYFQTTRIWLQSISHLSLPYEIDIFARQMDDIIEALEIGDDVSVGDICRTHISMSFRRLYSAAAAGR